MLPQIRPILAVVISSLFIFCAGARANDLVPRRDLLCAALLASSQFANHSETRQPEVNNADNLNLSDLEEVQLAVNLMQAREAGVDFNVLEFSREIRGKKNIADFMETTRQNAVQLEADLKASGQLSDKFWTAPRIKSFALTSVLPILTTGITIAGGHHLMTLDPSYRGYWEFMLGPALGANALLTLAIRDQFVVAGRYFRSIYDQAMRRQFQNADGDRAAVTNDLWRGMVDSPPVHLSSGPSLIVPLPLELANLLLDPPKSDANAKEVANYRELLQKAFAASIGKNVDLLDSGFRVFLFRFLAYQDQSLIIETTVYTPIVVPRRPGQQEVGQPSQSLPGARPALQGF